MTLWTAGSRSSGCGYGDAMLLRRAAAPIALLAAVALAGCTAPEPDPEPPIAPTEEPLFASEEEALAAAEEVYSAYMSTVDEVLNAGGEGALAIEQFASGEALETQKNGFEAAAARGLRSIGRTGLSSWQLQSFDGDAGTVDFYVCKDVSGVDVLDSAGNSVVSESRPDRGAAEVRIVDDGGNLKVAREAVWTAGLPGC